jgi:lysophospholipase
LRDRKESERNHGQNVKIVRMTPPRPACLAPDREDYIDHAGGRLRYAVWTAAGTPRGSVVLIHGRGEFIEKYAMEVAGELRGRGFAVYAVDIRGQGLSTRMLPDHDKGHIDDFGTYVADLAALMDAVVAPEAPHPRRLLSHSTVTSHSDTWLPRGIPGILPRLSSVRP